MSAMARRLAQSQTPTSAPRSKRYDDSLLRPARLEVLRMFTGKRSIEAAQNQVAAALETAR